MQWEPPSVEHLGELLPDFAIKNLIGRGGMGAVYLARHASLDRNVVIKLLPPKLAEEMQDLRLTERFSQEARAMAQLHHPGIVTIFDFGRVWDGSQARLFIDGEEMARREPHDFAVSLPDMSVLVSSIGGHHLGDRHVAPFVGKLDALRVSDGARYGGPFSPPKQLEKDGRTLALYHFDEAMGSHVEDVSGNGRRGIIVGNPQRERVEPADVE